MTQRFEKAYNALVKAFFEGTLAKGDCAACAVGNIVADAMSANVTLDLDKGEARCEENNGFWKPLFATDAGRQYKRWYPTRDADFRSALLEDLTGYSEDEMAQIEYAFETNTRIHIERYQYKQESDILEDQYRGLCAVVDVMLALDGIEPDPKYAAKFREHKSLQSC